MLAEMFKTVLIMSAVGGLLILFLLAAKPLTERFFGAGWQYYVWLSVLAVMMLPVKFSVKIKLPSAISSGLQTITARPATDISVFEDYSGVYMSKAVQGNTLGWFSAIAAVWLGVAVILIIKTVVSNIVLKNELHRNSIYCCDFGKAEIRISDKAGAPILFGGLKSVLYIPQGIFDTDKMQYITAHEGVHIRRNDIGVKWFMALVKCIHWFNPLVYFLARQLDEGCEISCDAEAVKTMSGAQKREYMQTILEVSQREINFKGSLSAGLSSGGKCLKKRFSAISKGDKTRPAIRVAGVAAAMIITFCSVCTCGIIRGSAEKDSQPVEFILVTPKEDLLAKPDDENNVHTEVVDENAAETVKTDIFEEKAQDTATEDELKTEVAERPVISGEFNSEDGDTLIIAGVKANEDGCINLEISSNAQEVIDVFVNDGESCREVHSFSIPVSHSASYMIDGLDKEKTYDIVLKGTMRNNWKIESEYKIY